MKWTVGDLQKMQNQPEYVDTIVVPLVKLSGQPNKIMGSATSAEFLMVLTMELENQFKGRVVLSPPFSYVDSMDMKSLGNSINNELTLTGAKTIFYLSSDLEWSEKAPDLGVHIVPSIPLNDMDQAMRSKIIEDQVRQLVPVLSSKWNAL
ncbi:DUF2487 family protein [Paenisporosarcina cavernae]|uniref:DUF2487 family protein n=1 Tax=Paenisporosarcina cavernae TaxID=2320858 RepID=A0A385YTZ0_9BACL|nr:DUF2487 family protein [Paenisporosarcina cavernae]AYC29397.1 DUF2487 family protein [Paenisporosarcina cavernae]